MHWSLIVVTRLYTVHWSLIVVTRLYTVHWSLLVVIEVVVTQLVFIGLYRVWHRIGSVVTELSLAFVSLSQSYRGPLFLSHRALIGVCFFVRELSLVTVS